MEYKKEVIITCPECSRRIRVAERLWGTFTVVTCPATVCGFKWRQVIPMPEKKEEPDPTLTDEILESAKDFLSGLSDAAKDFLGIGKQGKEE